MDRLLIPLLLVAALPARADDMAARLNDYPTEARADYVFACMEANGRTREMLQECSCSIDIIASILPYESYVDAETVLSMQRTTGEQSSLFKSSTMTQGMVADLRRAQAEAEMTCFHR